MKSCQWCDAPFKPTVSYQIYCSDSCRELATKQKIANRYAISRRNKLMSKPRKCKSCGSSLSVYNDEQLCVNCIINPTDVTKALKEIKDIASGKINLDE